MSELVAVRDDGSKRRLTQGLPTRLGACASLSGEVESAVCIVT